MGRDLLLRINDGQPKKNIDDKWAWVSQHIFPTESEPELVWEIIKKAGAGTIAAVKEWAPFVSTGVIPPTYIIQAINAPLAVRLGLRPETQIVSAGKGSVPGRPQFWKGNHGTEYDDVRDRCGREGQAQGELGRSAWRGRRWSSR